MLITDALDKQKIFKVEKSEKVTEIEEVSGEGQKQNIVYDLLGGSPTDLLLPPNFLIVEGESEEIFIETITKRFYKDKPVIKVIPASGFAAQAGRLVNAINKIYTTLSAIYGEKVVVMLDGPNSQSLKESDLFRKQYSEIYTSDRMFELPVPSIEDYYPVHIDHGRGGSDKKKRAKNIGSTITQEEFETAMPIMFHALQKTWQLSFGISDEVQENKEAAA